MSAERRDEIIKKWQPVAWDAFHAEPLPQGVEMTIGYSEGSFGDPREKLLLGWHFAQGEVEYGDQMETHLAFPEEHLRQTVQENACALAMQARITVAGINKRFLDKIAV